MFVTMQRLTALYMAAVLLIPHVACAQEAPPSKTTGTAAGVSWTVPTRWQAQAERPMRVATYIAPAAAGDEEGGECAVFFFGPGEGGNVEMNVARWQSQFEGADGAAAKFERKKAAINGINVTTVTASGTYLASMGPMFQSGAAKKPDFRMLGAIIEAPEGNVFVKFTGPEKTMTAAEKEFKAMLDTLEKK